MDQFLKWFSASPIAAFLRVFLAIFLAQAASDFVKFGKFDFANLETWAIVALASAIPPVIRWLNPEDKSFGNK